MSEPIRFELPSEAIDAIARLVVERLGASDDGYCSVNTTADFLDLSPGAVRKLIQRGELRAYRPNGRVLLRRSDVREWVEGGLR